MGMVDFRGSACFVEVRNVDDIPYLLAYARGSGGAWCRICCATGQVLRQSASSTCRFTKLETHEGSADQTLVTAGVD